MWCKFTKTTGGTEKPFAVDMMPDAIMADQSVWTVKVTAAFDPAQVAFVTTKEALENAQLTDITARQKVPTEDNHWTSVTGGKAVVIGGNAKTVMALFVTNAKALADYESLSATYNPREGSGITFKVAVCKTDNGVVTEAGSVTVPAAPTAPEGKQFAGWRVLEGEAGSKTEDLYGVNDKNTISIKENTILNVVWETATPTITLNLNGGAGIENTTFTVTYNNKLPTLATPTRDGVAFDGWVVSEDVTENGEFFAKGSAFDLDTPITADLKLTARWKHVHYYTCFQIGEFGDAMAEYQSYADTHHVAVCGCMDVALKAHSFDSNGNCACGYMYQNKPVNVEKYPPIYWDYKPNTVSYSGSINALIPVRFAQKNNQDHYIYGIAWLRYKKPDGAIETIYTPALATTLNGVGSSGTVTKSGS